MFRGPPNVTWPSVNLHIWMNCSFKPQLLNFHHLWFVGHWSGEIKSASLMKLHFMVRKTQEALKTIPPLHPDDTAGGSSLLHHVALAPRATASRLDFPSFPSAFRFLFGRVARASYIQSLIWYIHHSKRVGGDYISEKDVVCHIYERLSVWENASITGDVCVEQFEGGCALLFDWSEPVDVSVFWSECMCWTVRKCTAERRARRLSLSWSSNRSDVAVSRPAHCPQPSPTKCGSLFKVHLHFSLVFFFVFFFTLFVCVWCVLVHTSVSPALVQVRRTSQHPALSLKCLIVQRW